VLQIADNFFNLTKTQQKTCIIFFYKEILGEKMKKHIYFGEKVEGYSVPVLNEREARAGAGILFAFGMISFLNAFLLHTFVFTQIFITLFMVDFIIRVLINPKYSPSLILGRLFIQNQTPEYIGAAQKRFAWSIGLLLSVIMFVLVVVLDVMTPVKIIICVICLILLFSETAFGICLGCFMYHFIYKSSPHYCPGDVCEIRQKEEIQKISKLQLFIVIFSIVLLTMVTISSMNPTLPSETKMTWGVSKCGTGKCAND